VSYGLRIEGVDLAGAAGHEKEDDALGPGREMRRLDGDRVRGVRLDRVGGEKALLLEQRREGEHAEAAAGAGQEVAAIHAGVP